MTFQADDSWQDETGIHPTRDGRVIEGRNISPIREWAITPRDAHKQDRRNLWLTTALLDDRGRFIANFTIPHGTGPARFVDLLEVERQAGIVFAHRCLAIADDAAFLLTEISLDLTSRIQPDHSAGIAGAVNVFVTDPVETSAPPRKATMHFTINAHGHPIGQGTATVRFLPPKLYARLRGTAPNPSPLPTTTTTGQPELAGADAVTIDLTDPLLSDHSADHVPAMAVAAAIERTAAAEPVRRPLRALSLYFQEYIDHHPPATLRMEPVRDGQLHGQVLQGNITKASFSGRLDGAPVL